MDDKTDFTALLRPGLFGKSGGGVMTFKNIVIVLGAVTLLVFIGSVSSPRVAVLLAALSALAGLMLYDMQGRRKWEAQVTEQMRRISQDFDRLVRETARNRNDLTILKKGLATAGTLARSYGDLPGEMAEQRMLKAIADQLSSLDGAEAEGREEAQTVPMSGLAAVLGAAPTTPEAEQAVGSKLNDDQVLQIVNAAVAQDRIDVFLQPIVNLPQRKKRFDEMFSRIRVKQDMYLPAARYIAVALKQDLMPVIDNLLLLRGLQLLRDAEDAHDDGAFFCNVSSLTLNDPKFMGDLVEFIAQNRTLAPRLVFELAQHDLATMSAEVLPILDGLSRLGCRFSMDGVRSLSFDFAFLQARHIRFIKVEGALLLKEMKETGGFFRMKRLKVSLDAAGIDMIAEKIETEKQLIDLLDLDIDYGQGFLFGKPEVSGNIH